MFVTSAVLGSPLPLSRCEEAVPPRRVGNTMAEVKDGLERAGFTARGRAVRAGGFAKARGTFIAWVPPGAEVRTKRGDRFRSGHYVVLHRDADARWLYLDYPEEARAFEPDIWLAGVLSEFGLMELPVLEVSGSAAQEWRLPRPEDTSSAMDEAGVGEGPALSDVRPVEGSRASGGARQAAPDEGEPEIAVSIDAIDGELEHAVLDFGSRVTGQELAGVIALWNECGEEATIEGVRTSCACTVADGGVAAVEDGGVLLIPVRMSLVGRTGDVRQSVSMVVRTASGAKPVFVECVARAEPQWRVEPQAAVFGDVARDGPVAERRVRTQASFPREANRLIRAEGDDPCVSASLDAAHSAPERGQYEVIVRFDPARWRDGGVFAGSVNVFNDESPMMELVVPVTARVAEAVTVTPRRLLLTGARPTVGTVTCTHREGKTLRLLDSRTLTPGVTVAARELGRDRADEPAQPLRVELTWDPVGRGLSTYVVELDLTASDGSRHTVRVPVTISGS